MNNNLQFKIQATELLEIQLFQPKMEFDLNTIEFKIELEHKLDLKQNLLAVFCSVSMVSRDNQLGRIVVNCLYFVNKLNAISSQKQYKKEMKFLTDAVNSISISTTRGFLAAITRGTFLHDAILPIVDPRHLDVKTSEGH